MASKNKPLRGLFTVVMDVFVVAAVLVLGRLVVQFFGMLSSQAWGETVLRLTRVIVIPFGIESVKTPYGGVFDFDAVVTIVALLVVEWVLSIVRKQV